MSPHLMPLVPNALAWLLALDVPQILGGAGALLALAIWLSAIIADKAKIEIECAGYSCDEKIEVSPNEDGDPSEDEMEAANWQRVLDWFCEECSTYERHESGFDSQGWWAHLDDLSDQRWDER